MRGDEVKVGKLLIVIFISRIRKNFAPNRAALDNFIFELKQEFDLTAEDSIEDYLGVRVFFNKQQNTVTLSWTGLIDKILSTVFPPAGEYVKPHYTPAVDPPHGRDDDGSKSNVEWSYRSIIASLLYLANNTHPDVGKVFLAGL